MNNITNKELLKNKMEREFLDFKSQLLLQDKEYIINKAYEIVCYNEIILLIDDLPDEVVNILLEKEFPLWYCYDKWIGFDGGIHEDIFRCLECIAD